MAAKRETTIFVCPPALSGYANLSAGVLTPAKALLDEMPRRADNIYTMIVAEQIRQESKNAIEKLYGISLADKDIQLNDTKPEFEGDYTLVLFSFIKLLRKAPEQSGNEIGEYLLKNNSSLFSSYNVIKGFLNLTVNESCWFDFLQKNFSNSNYGRKEPTGKKVMVEYSSPNTNKP